MRESRAERGLKLALLGVLAVAVLAAPFAPMRVTDSTTLALAGLVVGLGVLVWAWVRTARRDGRDGFEFPGAMLWSLPVADRRRLRWARRRGGAVPEQLVPVLLRFARRQATNQAGVGWSMVGLILANAHNVARSDSPIPAPVTTAFWIAVAASGVWADQRARGWRQLAEAQEVRLQARVHRQWTP